jgi:hypothetical protein
MHQRNTLRDMVARSFINEPLDRIINVVVHAYHMARKKLLRALPVRIGVQDALDLRRWARQQSDGNVSKLIRDMIDERRRRERDISVDSPGQGAA